MFGRASLTEIEKKTHLITLIVESNSFVVLQVLNHLAILGTLIM